MNVLHREVLCQGTGSLRKAFLKGTLLFLSASAKDPPPPHPPNKVSLDVVARAFVVFWLRLGETRLPAT